MDRQDSKTTETSKVGRRFSTPTTEAYMSDIDSLVDGRATRRAWTGGAAGFAVSAAAAFALAFGVPAAELTRNGTMKMDEPMSGEMKKEGAKKRDVKQHAEKWDPKMKAMMEKEEKAMRKGSAQK